MEELISTDVPPWITNNSTFNQELGLYVFEPKKLVITNEALVMFAGFLSSERSLKELNESMLANPTALHGKKNLYVPKEYPRVVIKLDNAKESVQSLLSLSTIAKRIPRETEDYVFDPIDLYWATDQNDLSLLAMGRVDTEEQQTQQTHRNYIAARHRFIEEAEKVGLGINPMPYQDLLYCGQESNGRTVVSLVDTVLSDVEPRVD